MSESSRSLNDRVEALEQNTRNNAAVLQQVQVILSEVTLTMSVLENELRRTGSFDQLDSGVERLNQRLVEVRHLISSPALTDGSNGELRNLEVNEAFEMLRAGAMGVIRQLRQELELVVSRRDLLYSSFIEELTTGKSCDSSFIHASPAAVGLFDGQKLDSESASRCGPPSLPR